MSSQYAVHLSFGLITGAVLAILLYRREHLYFRISRFLLAGIDGMIFAACVCGASLSFSFLAEGISTIPLAIAIGAALQSYALVLAFLLFSALWSVRTLLEGLWGLRAGGIIGDHRRRLVRAALAALLTAGSAAGIQWARIGEAAPLDGVQLFYSTTIPAVVAFGWFASDRRRSSKLFAAFCLWVSVSVALAAFPMTFHDGRYGLSCPGGGEAYHRVLGFDGYSWNWRNSASEQALFGPAALMELTFWYLADPQPKC
jgi:hypothetical protein